MNYSAKSSFNRSYKKLSSLEQQSVDGAIQELKNFFDGGIRKEGLGIKRLKWDFWEIRASIRLRILFTLERPIVSFVVVGNHDDIRRYLKSL